MIPLVAAYPLFEISLMALLCIIIMSKALVMKVLMLTVQNTICNISKSQQSYKDLNI